MWQYNYSDELYHHGVLGQKWGVRRYQNRYGALTSSGKKHQAKLEAKYDELNKIGALSKAGKNKKTKIASQYKALTGKSIKTRQKEKAEEQAKKPTKANPAKSMTDEELTKAVTRQRLEISYRDNYKNLNPEKLTKGQKFCKAMKDTAIKNINDAFGATVKKGASALGDKLLENITGKKAADATKATAKEASKGAKDFKEAFNEAKSKATSNSGTSTNSNSNTSSNTSSANSSKSTYNSFYDDPRMRTNWPALPGSTKKKKY